MAATVGNLRVELSVGAQRATQAIQSFQNKMQKLGESVSSSANRVQTFGEKAHRGFSTAQKAIAKASQAMRDFNKQKRDPAGNFMPSTKTNLRGTQGELQELSASAGRVALSLGLAGAAVGVTFAKIESSLTRAAAVASGAGDGFNSAFSKMQKSALELAASSQFSAKEVADGMGFMAMAGNDAMATIEAMPAAVQLASAAQIGLAEASDAVTNIMAGFQIKADAAGTSAEKLADANNVLVGTFLNSNVGLGELAESMKIAGPVASSLGRGLEETAGVIGILGNAGIKGSLAGTGLKRILTSLAKDAAPKAKKALNALGVSMDLVNKQGMVGLVRQLEAAQEALGDEVFTGSIFTAFGERAGPQLAALVGQGSDALDKLIKKSKESKKANLSGEMQAKQMATLTGQFEMLKSTIEATSASFGKIMAPALRKVISALREVVAWFGELSPSIKKAIIVVATIAGLLAGLVATITAVAAAVVGGTIAFIGFVAIAGPAAAAVSAFAVAAAPIAGIVAGIGAAIGAVAWGAMSALSDDSSKVASATSKLKETQKSVNSEYEKAVSALADANAEMAKMSSMELGVDQMIELELATQRAKKLQEEVNRLKREQLKVSKEIAAVEGAERKADLAVNIEKTAKQLDEIKKKVSSLNKERSSGGLGIIDTYSLLNATKEQAELQKRLNSLKKIQNDITIKELTDAAKMQNAAKKLQEDAIQKERAVQALRQKNKGIDSGAAEKLAKIKKQLADTLKDISVDAEISLSGDLSQVERSLSQFAERMSEVDKLLLKAGKSPVGEEGNRAGAQLEAIMLEQVKSFLKGQQGAENFAETLKATVDRLNSEGFDLKAADIAPDFAPTILGAADEYAKGFAVELAGVGGNIVSAMHEAEKKIAEIQSLERNELGKTQETEKQEAIIAASNRMQQIATEKLKSRIIQEANNTSSLRDFDSVMESAKMALEKLGLSFSDVAKRIKKPSYQSSDRDFGKSIEGIIGEAFFKSSGGTARAAAAGDVVGSEVGGILAGSGGSVATAIGAAVGSAMPGVGTAIGATVGKIAGEGISNFFNSVSSMLSSIIPEERIKAPIEGLVVGAVIGGLTAAFAGLAATLSAAILPVILPAIVILAPLAAGAAAAIVLISGSMALLAAPLAVVAGVFAGMAAPILLVGAGVGALVGIFAGIITMAASSKEFERFTKAISTAVDGVMLAFEPLAQILMPIAGLFSVLIKAITPFVSAFSGGLAKSSGVIFDVFKSLAVAGGQFLIFVSQIHNFLMIIMNAIKPVFGLAIDAVTIFGTVTKSVGQAILSVAGFLVKMVEPFGGTLTNAVKGAATSLNALRDVPIAIGEALKRVDFTDFGIDTDQIQTAVDEIKTLTEGQAAAMADELANREDFAAATASLLNAPTGFKASLERFRAIQTTGIQDNVISPDDLGAATGTVFYGDITIIANDSEEAFRKFEEYAGAKEANAAAYAGAAQFNRGFG